MSFLIAPYDRSKCDDKGHVPPKKAPQFTCEYQKDAEALAEHLRDIAYEDELEWGVWLGQWREVYAAEEKINDE